MAKGSRSRNGCSNCRRRKRQCDEDKPMCLSCSRSGVECVYPTRPSGSSFIIAVSHEHYTVPFPGKPSFFNMTVREMKACEEKFRDCESSPDYLRLDEVCWGRQVPWDNHFPLALSLSRFSPVLESAKFVETSLIQYYAEVISTSRVYVQTNRNPFSFSVVPRVLSSHGPLRCMVLALSAAEWSRRVPTEASYYRSLSITYKVRALRELQQRFNTPEDSEENLLTCLLMTSLEIAEGSQPAWLKHLQGAFALLDNFSPSIDPGVARFVLTYFRFRYIMMKTTEPTAIVRHGNEGSSDLYHDHVISCLAITDDTSPLFHGPNSAIDELIGCSTEIVHIINEITSLSVAMSRQTADNPPIRPRAEGQLFERRIKQLSIQTLDIANEYLLTSAEAFRIAAQIYLRLACYDMSIADPSILDLHEALCACLQSVIVEGGPRRSFPMWPLFLAGCTSVYDAQRKTIIELFEIVNSQWPISNIAAVWTAVKTVWHSRDLELCTPATSSCKQQDWQDVIHRFGWKLALS
ncbi:fungal-specific transcription factor domain-containing protein [Aspergillus insuetus]